MRAAQITSYPFKTNQHTLARNHSGFQRKKTWTTLKTRHGRIFWKYSIGYFYFYHLVLGVQTPSNNSGTSPNFKTTQNKISAELPCVLETNTPSLVSLRERLPGTQKTISWDSKSAPLQCYRPRKEGHAVKTVTDPPLDEANHWVYWKQQHAHFTETYEIKNNAVFAYSISIHAGRIVSFDEKPFSCEATWNLSSTNETTTWVY